MTRNIRTTRTPAPNSGLAKVAVSFSADTFVVKESMVLRINICAENRHLRQAAKRYMPFYRTAGETTTKTEPLKS
jgi:hypothetical protein